MHKVTNLYNLSQDENKQTTVACGRHCLNTQSHKNCLFLLVYMLGIQDILPGLLFTFGSYWCPYKHS